MRWRAALVAILVAAVAAAAPASVLAAAQGPDGPHRALEARPAQGGGVPGWLLPLLVEASLVVALAGGALTLKTAQSWRSRPGLRTRRPGPPRSLPAGEPEPVRRASATGLSVAGDSTVGLSATPPVTRPRAEWPPADPVLAADVAPAPVPAPIPLPAPRPEQRERIWPRISPRTRLLLLAGVLVAGAVLRLWQIDAVGLNSDETVYAGQGASIAGDTSLAPFFPTFRAHPLLFQSIVSIGYLLHAPDVFGRLAAAALGLATVYVTYCLGRVLYGTRAGLIAGAILALMPYHVVVTRQILLDGPRTLMSTLTLLMLARFALTERTVWFHAAAAALGLTFLCKEDSVIMIGAIYAFLALTPGLRVGVRNMALAAGIFVAIAAVYPLSLRWAGHVSTGGDFLAWQLFRRPNHAMTFYPTVVPPAIGLGVVAAAALGLWLLRREASWRETLLLSWIAVPVCFYELFPVKGYQYLLPIAPAVALLAARFVAHWDPRSLPSRGAAPLLRGRRTRRVVSALAFLRRRRIMPVALAVLLLSLVVPSWQRVQRASATTFLAGSGGLPGGRSAGLWIARHVPEGAQMMSVGPSMANVLEFYGHRKVYGLSVSPNPLHRNPVYEAMRNPDLLIRDNELQYVVWDAFSADRSPFFARRMMRYVERYHGRVAHTETVTVKSPDGVPVRRPVIVIYEVSP